MMFYQLKFVGSKEKGNRQMNKFFKSIAALAALFVFFIRPALAETMYTTVLVVDVRAEPSSDSPIVTYARTSEALEVLETQGAYLKVRTIDGKTGWMKKQYATSEHPQSLANEKLEKEIERLKTESKDVEEVRLKLLDEMSAEAKKHNDAAAKLKNDLEKAEAQAAGAASELATLEKKYEKLQQTAKSAVQISEEKDKAKAELESLSEKNRLLENENTRLKRSAAIKWFIAGAAILAAGYIFGSVQRKKKGRFSTYG